MWIMTLLILIVCLLPVVAVWAESAQTYLPSLSYNKSEKFLETSGSVFHMELDLYKNDGSIVFSTTHSLQTTNGVTVWTLANTTGWFFGFKQLNSTHVAVVDKNLNCIKMLNRENNQLDVFAGTCGRFDGNAGDGPVGVGKLAYPHSIDIDVRNSSRLLVLDRNSRSIRSVDLRTGVLGSVISSGFAFPRGMLKTGNKLLVSNENYISEVKWSINGTGPTNTKLTGCTENGYADGSFSIAKFNAPYELLEVGDDLYLVADGDNFRLRLLNLKSKTVIPVCTNGETPCINSTRQPSRPYSLLKVGNDLFVGMRNIYKLSGSNIDDLQVCPYTNLTVYTKPGEETAEFTLHCGNAAVLTPGIHQFRRKHNSQFCSYFVHVLNSPVIRTLVFKAEYEVTCSALNDYTTSKALKSVLQQRKSQLQRVCEEDCTMSSTELPWYVCDDSTLTVYWPTDQVYGVNVVAPPPTLTDKLKERLQSTPEACKEIFILSHRPPLVEAKKNAGGEFIQISFTSACSNERMAYNAEMDNCLYSPF